MKKMKKFTFLAAALTAIAAMQVGVVGCSDDPGLDNYYTSTKEYASDYLMNRDQYSQFVEILRRATGERGDLRLVDMLGTYGSYTVFAPTNDAVSQYLAGRGLSSVDELSKEDCDTIALNSIIEQAYFTTDYSDAQYPKANMLEHIMSISCDTLLDDAGVVQLQLLIN
ncbi:MAG: fasciclin domain-containing protein, partial [Bacteroidaceae bacterium]|nr:fasciclin domain-containing protein [Bacteroidaceae bacterium]